MEDKTRSRLPSGCFVKRQQKAPSAGMVKLADTADSKSAAARRGGSSPSTRTKFYACGCIQIDHVDKMQQWSFGVITERIVPSRGHKHHEQNRNDLPMR